MAAELGILFGAGAHLNLGPENTWKEPDFTREEPAQRSQNPILWLLLMHGLEMQTVLYELQMKCTKILQLPRHRCRNTKHNIMHMVDW